MIKKTLLTIATALTLSAKTITIAGPSAGVTHPVFNMIQENGLNEVVDKIKFKQWKGPDELKALILNKKVDFIAVPITAGSILYNRGADVQMISLVMGGTRGIVSNDPSVKTIKDLKGKTLGITARGGLSESLIKILLKQNGLDPKKDLKIVYTQNSKNSTLYLLKGKIDCTILAEPRLSMALKKAKSLPQDKTPHKLFFNISLLDAWKKAFNTNKAFAQVGWLAVGDTIKDKKLITAFLQQYQKSLKNYITYPDKSAKLTTKYFKGLHPKAIKNGIKNSNYYVLDTLNNKKEIKELLGNLLKYNPKSMGNKLPDDGFYFSK